MNVNLPVLTSVLGSLLTAFSVFFAVYVYIRKRDSDAFAALRTSLVDIRTARDLYEQAVTEAAFSEIGVSIANQLRAIYPLGCTREDVIALLTEPDKRDYLVTAIHLGLQESKSRKQALERSERLMAIPSQYESNMPLISEVLRGCIVYVTRSLEIVASVGYYVGTILDGILKDQAAGKETLEELKQIESIDILFREIAEVFYRQSASGAREASAIAEAAAVIINTFTTNILTRSDAELRRLRRRNARVYRTRRLPRDAETDIDQAFFYLEQIKNEFSEHEWNVMLQAKMAIAQLTK